MKTDTDKLREAILADVPNITHIVIEFRDESRDDFPLLRKSIYTTPEALRSLVTEADALRAKLAQWQKFAGFNRSCALSGESNPLTFEEFVARQEAK